MEHAIFTNKIEYSRNLDLIEKIKEVVEQMLTVGIVREDFSVYISKRLQLNYAYLENSFSEITGISIAHFITEKKIDRATELLINGNYSIGQIAGILHYNNAKFFCNQFKKFTGVNPTNYKAVKH